MKLLPEHEKHFTPFTRAGIFFLTLKGEVVYVDESPSIFKDIIRLKNHWGGSFDGFSYIIGTESDRDFLTSEFRKLYLGK